MGIEQVDFELVQEVMTELQDRLPMLEDDLHQLVRFRESPELVASAFRHIHSIKSDFSYCQAQPIADFVHLLENVLQSLRERRFLCSPLIAEAILQSLDRVRDMALTLQQTRQFDDTPLTGLLASLDELSTAPGQNQADQAARHVLLAAHNPGVILQGTSRWAETQSADAPAPLNTDVAMLLGHQLCEALAERQPRWQQRAKAQIDLVLMLNRQYPQPMAEQPLILAVLWHDVGLLALPDLVFTTPPKPKDPLWETWTRHPERAAQWLLSVDSNCKEAAQIIRQHHQWADGKGFPLRSERDGIHPGAQMIACADAFFEGVAGLAGEDYRRAALRAVFDIHGDFYTRYDAMLINAFQAVSRELTHVPAERGPLNVEN